MKAHKYWSMGAFVCMLMAMLSGHDMESKEAHKYWALAAFGCMIMAIYTGHKMVRRKPKKPVSENQKTEEPKADNEDTYPCGMDK